MSRSTLLLKIYACLLERFGQQAWWPAKSRFEIIVGAILTQNTSWSNVEKAIAHLRRQDLLHPQALKNVSLPDLAAAIRPAGAFNVKAGRLKAFVSFFYQEYDACFSRMQREPGLVLRQKLLGVHGIGQETADCILLYALDKPFFVVDTYTKRFLERHGWMAKDAGYPAVQQLWAKNLPNNPKLFNEYHALLVALGKNFCRSRPSCAGCPLQRADFFAARECSRCRKVFGKKENVFVTAEQACCVSCR